MLSFYQKKNENPKSKEQMIRKRMLTFGKLLKRLAKGWFRSVRGGGGGG